jgi:16S rRNA (guanine966-N2)-methyltransferase
MHSSKGSVRIVGGEYRSRRLRVASRPGLRPTPDRVRETLFNWLGQNLASLACLDLFAGSGALGFEAASRGAQRVVMVERDRAAVELLRQNCAALGAINVEIRSADAFDYVKRTDARFDLVFLDPPFRQNAVPALLAELPRLLNPQALVYAEGEKPAEPVPPWRELKRARAGQVSFQLLRWESHDPSGVSRHV